MFISHIGSFDSMGGNAEGEVSESMTKIQFELLHMFGAVMTASKVSASHIFGMVDFAYLIPPITKHWRIL